jgi:hypothetical protein
MANLSLLQFQGADLDRGACVAAEHIPSLYSVLGRVFEDGGQAFRQQLLRAAHDAELAHEAAVQQHMQETGCDRLEAVQFMETTALQRLQER